MEKETRKYSLISNVLFSLKFNWRESPSTLIRALLGVLARITAPFAAIMMPKLVIDALTLRYAPAEFILSVGGGAAVLAALTFLRNYTNNTLTPGNEIGLVGSGTTPGMIRRKQMDMDFELLSDPEIKKLEDKAYIALDSNHSAANNLPCYLAELIAQLGGFALYGTVISSVHWGILPPLALSAGISWLMQFRAQKYEEKHREEISETQRKYWHIVDLLNDPAPAKDIRLYSMLGWLKDNRLTLFKKFRRQTGEIASRGMQARLVSAATVLLRDGAAYAVLTYLLIKGRVTLGDFTLMFAAIGAFAGWAEGMIVQASNLKRASVQIGDFRVYLAVPDRMNRGPGAPLPAADKPPEITLENVSYTYPGAEHPALENINLTIRAGERLAVVGVNGAGKSTLVKLLCGLYRPTVGIVRLNGVNIAEFNRDEYYTLFSAVFQEINLMTTTISGNVSQSTPEETDPKRVEQCLKLSGFWDKVSSLPRGADTELVKEVEPTAIELSGGEKQKLALARAIYKDAPVIVLDEPTAALDPIAESETYQRYAELTAGKTSVYISHRLASTRFCDRIIMLSEQKIAETGTHDELLALGGKYAEMFNIQASYYRNTKSEDDANENR
ncbi:MAG: ABC transporter ATP-binding protein/permease [Oscillospiraceae bacterium]|jgi:ATP-binding cassette subfamily B protein|nr:ABC transporter ATP-binding protein/permease [Oscillospiraceae bacterium]